MLNILTSEETKKNVKILPPVISLYITYACQLKCPHCFLTQTGKLNQFSLPLDAIKNVIEDAYHHQVFMMIVSGGDPLLHPDFFEMLTELKKYKIMPLIGITGLDVTEEQVKKFKSLNINTLQVSLDGISEEKNRKIRGDNVFKGVIESVKIMQSGGMNVNLAVCLNRHNKNELENLLHLALKLNIFKVKVQLWRDFVGDSELSLTLVEKEKAIELCASYNKRLQKEWIAIPGVDLDKGNLIDQNQYPPLVIGADGEVTIGELGTKIGNIYEKRSISEIYGEYVSSEKRKFIENILMQLKNEHNIKSIEKVEENKLFSNAMVYKYKNEFYLLYREDLPLAIAFFSIIHEIGHIVENTLGYHIAYDQNIEKSANIWAIQFLKKYTTSHFYNQAILLAHENEEALYTFVRESLLTNLINFWELKEDEKKISIS